MRSVRGPAADDGAAPRVQSCRAYERAGYVTEVKRVNDFGRADEVDPRPNGHRSAGGELAVGR